MLVCAGVMTPDSEVTAGYHIVLQLVEQSDQFMTRSRLLNPTFK